jgi:ABC-type phosphate transport system permease subunit
MAHRLFANKKLLVIAASVIVVVIVLAAIFLLPLLGQAVEFVDKSGVKGVIDRVWQDGGGGRK